MLNIFAQDIYRGSLKSPGTVKFLEKEAFFRKMFQTKI